MEIVEVALAGIQILKHLTRSEGKNTQIHFKGVYSVVL